MALIHKAAILPSPHLTSNAIERRHGTRPTPQFANMAYQMTPIPSAQRATFLNSGNPFPVASGGRPTDATQGWNPASTTCHRNDPITGFKRDTKDDTKDRADLRYFTTNESQVTDIDSGLGPNAFHTMSRAIPAAEAAADANHWTANSIKIAGSTSDAASIAYAYHYLKKQVQEIHNGFVKGCEAVIAAIRVGMNQDEATGNATLNAILTVHGRAALAECFHYHITSAGLAQECATIRMCHGKVTNGRSQLSATLSLDATYNDFSNNVPHVNHNGVNIVPILVDYLRMSCVEMLVLCVEHRVVTKSNLNLANGWKAWVTNGNFPRLAELRVEDLPVVPEAKRTRKSLP